MNVVTDVIQILKPEYYPQGEKAPKYTCKPKMAEKDL